jgi:predicted transposase YbfD/YdcC
MDHTTRAVLAQRQVNGAPGEVPAFRPLLAGLDLAGTVVTADALHTHPGAAEFLVTGKQAHYLFCVKANQPTLLDRCQRLAWHRVPVLDRTRDHGHGRVELRTLKAVTVNHFGLPHAAQVLQVTRTTRNLRTRRWRTVTIYAITSLSHAQASPARLADLLREHWTIENGLHWVRDVTFAEDASRRQRLRHRRPLGLAGAPRADPDGDHPSPDRTGRAVRQGPVPHRPPGSDGDLPGTGHGRDHPRQPRWKGPVRCRVQRLPAPRRLHHQCPGAGGRHPPPTRPS